MQTPGRVIPKKPWHSTPSEHRRLAYWFVRNRRLAVKTGFCPIVPRIPPTVRNSGGRRLRTKTRARLLLSCNTSARPLSSNREPCQVQGDRSVVSFSWTLRSLREARLLRSRRPWRRLGRGGSHRQQEPLGVHQFASQSRIERDRSTDRRRRSLGSCLEV